MIGRILLFILTSGVSALIFGPVLSILIGYASDSLTAPGEYNLEKIIMAWVFGGIFGAIPALASLLLSLLISFLKIETKQKNLLIFFITMICLTAALIIFSEVSSELGVTRAALMIGYIIPPVLVFLLFKPIKLQQTSTGKIQDAGILD